MGAPPAHDTRRPAASSPDPPRGVRVRMRAGRRSFARLVHNALDEEDCAQLLASVNAKGYTPALLNIGGGRQMLRCARCPSGTPGCTLPPPTQTHRTPAYTHTALYRRHRACAPS